MILFQENISYQFAVLYCYNRNNNHLSEIINRVFFSLPRTQANKIAMNGSNDLNINWDSSQWRCLWRYMRIAIINTAYIYYIFFQLIYSVRWAFFVAISPLFVFSENIGKCLSRTRVVFTMKWWIPNVNNIAR